MSESQPPELRLVVATDAQASLVWELTLAAYEEYRDTLVPPSGVFEETLRDVHDAIAHGGIVIAWIGDEPAGCGRYEIAADRSSLYFERLAVPPAQRRRGIASAIVRWFEAKARELGVPEVRLGARLALPGNIALYSGLGYTIYAYEDRPGYGRVSAEMCKHVLPAPGGGG